MMRVPTIWCLLLIMPARLVAQETTKGPAATKDEQKSSSRPSTLKLYDVPSPPEVGGQSPDEVAYYVKITQTGDPKQQTEFIEDFLVKYPGSRYSTTLHQLAAEAYQRVNNFDKLIEHGEKSLQSSPNNAALMAVMALAYASWGDSEKAIEQGSKAASIMEGLQPSPNVDPAVFAAQRSRYLAITYTSLGTAFLSRYETAKRAQPAGQPAQSPSPTPAQNVTPSTGGGNVATAEQPVDPKISPADRKPAAATDAASLDLAKAEGYYSRALELDQDYEFAEFQLGIIYAHKRQVAPSLEAFSKVIAMGGPLSAPAKEHFERIYKISHKNSLQGSEELIEKAKSALADRKALAK